MSDLPWQDQCLAGRKMAADAMRDAYLTGNMPQLVKKMRDAAADASGYGVGFVYAIGEGVAK